MLKILCILLIFIGICTMSASIFVYQRTLKIYKNYFIADKNISRIQRMSILVMMIFFLIGYAATLFYVFELSEIDMSFFLIVIIFFFGAIFCYSVVLVQSKLLNRLEESKDELKKAFEESKTANITLEGLNKEMLVTMDALKKAQNQLIFSEKMTTLGELMAGVSHEINTPICAIRASALNLTDSFSEQYTQLFLNIRQLSEEDFNCFIHYTEIAVINTSAYTSTSETRALKRKAKQILEDEEGFDDTIFELMVRNSLLDNGTVISIIPHLTSGTFAEILELVSKTVSMITSMDTISIAVERVIKLVSSLKSFSHHNANNEKTAFNIATGIETVLSIYVNQLKYDVEVETNFEDVPDILGYEDQLSQVWSNLIQNAIHAINNNNSEGHQDGKLKIDVKKIDTYTDTNSNQITVSFSDNGSGISPEKIDKIFEPFYTTKSVGIGTGLGLSISKQIIDKHNGTIQVESVEGIGTTFTITLPLTV